MLLTWDYTLSCKAYSCVDHEPQNVLNTVECQDTPVHPLPHLLVIHAPMLDCSPQLVDILRVRDCNLQIRALLVALEAQQVLPCSYLDRMDGRLVLRQLSFQVGLEAIDV